MKSITLRTDEVKTLVQYGKDGIVRPVKWPIVSQTDGAKRRIWLQDDMNNLNLHLSEPSSHPCQIPKTPFGKVGSRFWVKETWSDDFDAIREAGDMERLIPPIYKANFKAYPCHSDGSKLRWKSSASMKKENSRLVIEIISLRIRDDLWIAGVEVV